MSVEDSYGNAEPTYDGNVSVALAGLGGTLSIPASNGVANFSGLSLDQAGSHYAILATAAGLSGATTTSFAVTPADPAQLAITTQPPSSLTAGTGFGLSVAVEDAFGNAEPNYDGNVSVALAGLVGTLTIPASNGMASFSGLSLDQAGKGYTIQAGAAGLSSTTTSAFAVTPASPAQLVITTQPPASVTAGDGFGLAVAVEDAFGNAEPTYEGNVSVALAGLGGTLSIPASNGVANFSGLSLDQAGKGYTIQATAAGLSGATTTAFAVTPANSAQLVITAQPPSSVAAGAGFGLAVSVEDTYGNAEPNYNGNVSIALTGLGGTLTIPASGGVAEFSGLTLDQAGSRYTIRATAAGLSSATTTAFAVTPADPAELVITAQPPSSLTAGTGFGLSVAVEDAFGNAESSYKRQRGRRPGRRLERRQPGRDAHDPRRRRRGELRGPHARSGRQRLHAPGHGHRADGCVHVGLPGHARGGEPVGDPLATARQHARRAGVRLHRRGRGRIRERRDRLRRDRDRLDGQRSRRGFALGNPIRDGLPRPGDLLRPDDRPGRCGIHAGRGRRQSVIDGHQPDEHQPGGGHAARGHRTAARRRDGRRRIRAEVAAEDPFGNVATSFQGTVTASLCGRAGRRCARRPDQT